LLARYCRVGRPNLGAIREIKALLFTVRIGPYWFIAISLLLLLVVSILVGPISLFPR